MKIDLNQEIADHFALLKALAREAAEDEEENYSSRASAMNSVTTMLKELTKEQQKVINMERLARVEKVVIQTVIEFIPEQEREDFLKELERMLDE